MALLSTCFVHFPHARSLVEKFQKSSPTLFLEYPLLDSPKKRHYFSKALKLNVFCATGDGIKKVQEIIGRVNGEDKKTGFGPPPPKNLDGGSGFINLAGLDEVLAGKREFNIKAEKNDKNISSAADEIQNEAEKSGSELEKNISKASEDSPGKSFLLPNKLTEPQRLATLGMILFTIIAFGNGSQDILPENLLSLLQNLMRFAWISHTISGVIAAIIVLGKGEPPLKWFVKVLGSGLLGLQEAILLPKKE